MCVFLIQTQDAFQNANFVNMFLFMAAQGIFQNAFKYVPMLVLK